jgi:hypothetical protein
MIARRDQGEIVAAVAAPDEGNDQEQACDVSQPRKPGACVHGGTVDESAHAARDWSHPGLKA